jgi:hypothetical protein
MNKHFSNSNNDPIVAAAIRVLSGKLLNEEQNISGRFKFYASEKDYIETEAATYADLAFEEGRMSWDEAYIENKKRATLIHNNIMTNKQIKQRIIAILDNYTTEMEGYSYYGSNPGVSEDDYEDIANDILKEFEVIG